jgi:hypothetical protein
MASRLTTNMKLLIVLAVLGGAAGVKAFVGRGRFETGESEQSAAPLFASLKKEDVTAVLIEAPESKRHELVKEGDHWTVASEGAARADQNDVNKVLDAIVRLKKGKVASSNVERLGTYGLDEAKRTKVTAWGKEGREKAPVAAFVLGKAKDDWRNVFLRLPDESSIRKIEGSLSDFEPGSDDTWRDKTIFDHGPAEQVARIELNGPKGTVVLERRKVMGPKEPEPGEEGGNKEGEAAAGSGEEVAAKSKEGEGADGEAEQEGGQAPKVEQEVKEKYWMMIAPQEARAKTWLCDSIAGYVAKLECESFGTDADKPAELGLDPPQYTIRVTREGETEPRTILLLGNQNKDKKYVAKLPDLSDKPQPQIWWIASWKGDYLTKTVEDLLETPPAKPEERKPERAEAEGERKTDEVPEATADEKPEASTEEKPEEKSGDAAPEAKPAKTPEPAPSGRPGPPAGGGESNGAKPESGGNEPASPGTPPQSGNGAPPPDRSGDGLDSSKGNAA